jgi:exodeoxyribonuclease V gamma subunit
VAKSAIDDTSQEPSVLLAELCEYIGQSFCLSGDQNLDSDASASRLIDAISTQHPLQAVSQQYYQQQDGFFSYQQRWLPLATVLQSGFDQSPSDETPLSTIELKGDQQLQDLQQFARAPSHCFFQRRLKVFYPRLQEQLVESEAFSLDPLSRYQLDTQLLNARLKGYDFDHQQVRHLASGMLPQFHFGQIALEARWHELDSMVAALLPYFPKQSERQRVNLSLGKFTLQGWVEPSAGSALIDYRAGSLRAPDVMQLWLNHLAYHAMDYPALPSLLFGRSQSISLSPVDSELAKQQLLAWLECFENSHNKPCVWAPRSIWTWFKVLWTSEGELSDDPVKLAKAYSSAKESYEGGFVAIGENQDTYLNQLIYDYDAQWQPMLDLASPLVSPIFEHMERNDYE